MTEEQVLNRMKQEKLVAIVRGVKKEYIIKTARAILEGGITCLEITIDHKSHNAAQETYDSIRLLCEEFKDRLCIGAGTVLTLNEVEQSVSAGADYIISPNTDEEVIRKTKSLHKVSMPGAFTPTEAVRAYEAGADIVKLFPAGLLGTAYIKAIRGPLAHIPFSAVGGITPENGKEFIDAGCVALGVGGNLVSVKAIEAGDFKSLTETAKQYCRKLQFS